jgi:hypothetical protein
MLQKFVETMDDMLKITNNGTQSGVLFLGFELCFNPQR